MYRHSTAPNGEDEHCSWTVSDPYNGGTLSIVGASFPTLAQNRTLGALEFISIQSILRICDIPTETNPAGFLAASVYLMINTANLTIP